MREKSQANIIVVVLLILIVLVAFAIVWLVVRNVTQDKGDDVDIQPFLLGADIESFILSDNFTAEVKVTRTSGGGNITGMRFVFKGFDDSVYYYLNDSVPGILETKTYIISNDSLDLEDLLGLTEVAVYYVYENKNNEEKTTHKLDTQTRGGGGDGGGGGDPSCTPSLTCADYVGQCGVFSDGCSATLACGCGNDTYCYTGEGTNNVCINDSIQCYDSDEDNNPFFTKGNVTLDFIGYEFDVCIDTIDVTENYCYYNGSEFSIRNESVVCDDGCLDGACQLPECTEDPDCSSFNLPLINRCNDPFIETAPANNSVCNLDNTCSSPSQTIASECSVTCNAQCDVLNPCADSVCPADGCVGDDYYTYTSVSNACLDSCSCEDNACTLDIIYGDEDCVGVPDCSEGPITETCTCGGTEYTDNGYCCGGVWSASECVEPTCINGHDTCCNGIEDTSFGEEGIDCGGVCEFDCPSNWKSGIDVLFDGTPGIDYAEEYFYHDKLIDDHKVVYIKADTPIIMGHNERNVRMAFEQDGDALSGAEWFATGVEVGEYGEDGVPINIQHCLSLYPNQIDEVSAWAGNSCDDGIIRFKIDGDLSWNARWGVRQNGPNDHDPLPAYVNPFTFNDLEYTEFDISGNSDGVSVVNSFGNNGELVSDRDNYYHYGIIDNFGDEWHTIIYGDDDSWQSIYWSGTEYERSYASDGKSFSFVVNPKTPLISFENTTDNGQFYTTPAKLYYIPKINNQTTYLTGDIEIKLININDSRPVYYRFANDPFVEYTGSLNSNDISDGVHYLEYYYDSNYHKTRKIIKNPGYPSAGEGHPSEYLFKNPADLDDLRLKVSNSSNYPYYNQYNRLVNDAPNEENFPILTGRRPNFNEQYALQNALIAAIEDDYQLVKSGESDSYANYAKHFLLENFLTLDPVGVELRGTSHGQDTIGPAKERHNFEYYLVPTELSLLLAYDLIINNYKSSDFGGSYIEGITPIEDYKIRDSLAQTPFKAQMALGRYTHRFFVANNQANMAKGVRSWAGFPTGLIMPNYKTDYYGTSGANGDTEVADMTIYPDNSKTWMEMFASAQGEETLEGYPNQDNEQNIWYLIDNEGFWHDNNGYWPINAPTIYLFYLYRDIFDENANETYPNINTAIWNSINGVMEGEEGFMGYDYVVPYLINSQTPEIAKASQEYCLAGDQICIDDLIYDMRVGTTINKRTFGLLYYEDNWQEKYCNTISSCSDYGDYSTLCNDSGVDLCGLGGCSWEGGICDGGVQPTTCQLTNAYWTPININETDSVSLIVEGSNCNGEEISFEVYEQEILFDNPADINPVNVSFSGDSATGTWIAEYQSDWGTPNEWYFVATLVNNASEDISSEALTNGLLVVSEVSVPDCSEGPITETCTCGGTEYTDNGYCCGGVWSDSECVVDENTYYVSSSATGNDDGSDWTNAHTDLPDPLIRGATYYIADGTYSGYDFNDGVSGTEYITIKKATQQEHGTETGWNLGTMGDGQAQFSPLHFNSDHYIFDGVYEYGFRVFDDNGVGGYVIEIDGDYVTINNSDLDGNFGNPGNHVQGACNVIDSNGHYITFANSNIHNAADDGLQHAGYGNNLRVINNRFHNLYGCGTDGGCGDCYNGHSDALEIGAGTTIVDAEIAGNLIYDVPSTSGGTYYNMNNLNYYNNIVYLPEGDGLITYFRFHTSPRIYNNVFWGRTMGNYGGIAFGEDITDMQFRNNIVLSINYEHLPPVDAYNPTEHIIEDNVIAVELNHEGLDESINNIIADPLFIDIPLTSRPSGEFYLDVVAENFSLTANSPARNAGVNLGAPYNLDLLGNIRTDPWDIGAIEYDSACNQPSDCGIDGFIGQYSCSNGDVYDDYRTYFCIDSVCSSLDVSQLYLDCTGEEVCNSVTGSCYVPSTGNEIAYYMFENNADDSSGNENHGTWNGNEDYVTGYNGGQAASFDGNTNNYVSVGDIGLTDDWSVNLWVNVQGSGPVISYPIGFSGDSGVYVEYDSHADNWGFYDGSTDTFESINLNEDEWYMLSVTKSGNDYIIYLDGTLEDSTTLLDIDISDLNIGRRQTGFPFNGYVDEVRIYDYALTENEVLAIYNGETPSCDLTSASWSTDAVVEGTNVDLVVEGSYCGGEEINYTIWEVDGGWFWFDKEIMTTSTAGSASWIAGENDTDFNDGDEYYFVAVVSDNETEEVDSRDFGGDLVVSEDTCNNGAQDGGETDMDCGGICSGCLEGEGCNDNGDCLSGNCSIGNVCGVGATGGSLEQHGITWYFDKPVTTQSGVANTYQYGTFVNGDYWVVNPDGGDVVVTRITPDCHHSTDINVIVNGAMTNPVPGDYQGYHGAAYGWTSSLNVAPGCTGTPLVLATDSDNPIQSLVSTIGRNVEGVYEIPSNNGQPRLQTAAVLTILDSIPSENSFRPPYSGNEYFEVPVADDINMSIFGSLSLVGIADYYYIDESFLEDTGQPRRSVLRWVERPQLYHGPNSPDNLKPLDNMPAYGQRIARVSTAAALMLNLDYPLDQQDEKDLLLIYYLQWGIDTAGVKACPEAQEIWRNNGGFLSGKIPVSVVAAKVFDKGSTDERDFSNVVKNQHLKSGQYSRQNGYSRGGGTSLSPGSNLPPDYTHYGNEHDQIYYVSQPDIDFCNNGNNPEWYPDDRYPQVPFTEGDGGLPSFSAKATSDLATLNRHWFQSYQGVSTGNMPGEALAAQVMDLKEIWNNPAFFDYADRYIDILEDIEESGGPRTLIHGTNGIDHETNRRFIWNLWQAYRDQYGCIWTRDDTTLCTEADWDNPSSSCYSQGYYHCPGDGEPNQNLTCASGIGGNTCTGGKCGADDLNIATCLEYDNQRACKYNPCNNDPDLTIGGCEWTGTECVDEGSQQVGGSLEQYGITWYFDRDLTTNGAAGTYQYGQFVNGDYWVVNPDGEDVVVTRISPDYNPSTQENGWEVNPSSFCDNGFDGEISVFTESLIPSFNYTASPNESIVKTTTYSGSCSANSNGCLSDAVVLTILGEVPPENSFRPPYFGIEKPIYSANNLRTDLLPSLDAPAGIDNDYLQLYEGGFKRVHLDHRYEFPGAEMRPNNNFYSSSNYGADVYESYNNALLLLMLNESQIGNKTNLTRYYVQQGIDRYYIHKNGFYWNTNGGHNMARKTPIIFAGVMLDDNEIMAVGDLPLNLEFSGQLCPDLNHGSPRAYFQEDGQTFYVTQEDVDGTNSGCNDENFGHGDGICTEFVPESIGLPEWGLRHSINPDTDDYGWIADYRYNNVAPNVGHVLGLQIASGFGGVSFKEIYGHDAFFDYYDRVMWNHVNVEGVTGYPPSSLTVDMWNMYRDDYGCTWKPDDEADLYSQGYYHCPGDGEPNQNLTCASGIGGNTCTGGKCNFPDDNVSTCDDYTNQRAIDYDPCNVCDEGVQMSASSEEEQGFIMKAASAVGSVITTAFTATVDFVVDVFTIDEEEKECVAEDISVTCGENSCDNKLNNCNEVVNCGECQAGYNCENNNCVGIFDDEPAKCISKTCASLEKTCGSWSDGCGNALDCGGCNVALGDVCSNGVCVAQDACNDTCTSLGYGCGMFEICGEAVDCNGCDAGFSCELGVCVEEIVPPSCIPEDNEICYDNIDNDCDELIDCLDNDCSEDSNCVEEVVDLIPQDYVLSWESDGGEIPIEISDDSSLDLEETLTISAWINPTSTSNLWNNIIFKGQNSGPSICNYQFAIASNNRLAFDYYDSGWDPTYSARDVIEIGVLQHVAVTVDSSGEIILYKNGLEISRETKDNSFLINDLSLVIGADIKGTQLFDGLIDDVLIYNRALSASEISDIYNSQAELASLSLWEKVKGIF